MLVFVNGSVYVQMYIALIRVRGLVVCLRLYQETGGELFSQVPRIRWTTVIVLMGGR